MGKPNQNSGKFNNKNGKNVPMKFKNNKYDKDVKQKPKPNFKQNKVAELIEQKKQAKIEKQQQIAQYKKKRLEKTKVISKKTSRGQPLMKDRIEFLLKQIQEMKKK